MSGSGRITVSAALGADEGLRRSVQTSRSPLSRKWSAAGRSRRGTPPAYRFVGHEVATSLEPRPDGDLRLAWQGLEAVSPGERTRRSRGSTVLPGSRGALRRRADVRSGTVRLERAGARIRQAVADRVRPSRSSSARKQRGRTRPGRVSIGFGHPRKQRGPEETSEPLRVLRSFTRAATQPVSVRAIVLRLVISSLVLAWTIDAMPSGNSPTSRDQRDRHAQRHTTQHH